LESCCNDSVTFLVTSPPLDIKVGVEAPPGEADNTTIIVMSNTRTHDVGLLSSGRPEPV
jgi:hypothetical protein